MSSRTYPTRHTVLGSHEQRKEQESRKPKEGHRETVEAIVVAMILALLGRGVEAEAFVIPTGSMAPTVMGRHKEIPGPQGGDGCSVEASERGDGVGGGHPHRPRRAVGGGRHG